MAGNREQRTIRQTTDLFRSLADCIIDYITMTFHVFASSPGRLGGTVQVQYSIAVQKRTWRSRSRIGRREERYDVLHVRYKGRLGDAIYTRGGSPDFTDTGPTIQFLHINV